MKSLLIILLVFAFNSVHCLFGQLDYKCDFSFGDPTWNYSEVFYEKDFKIVPGQRHFQTHLPKTPGQMISFVCVNLEGTRIKNAIVDFTSLFHLVTVDLTRAEYRKVNVHILAKQHGY